MPAADGVSSTTPIAHEPSTGPRLRVFVSYSRKDTAFADEVVAGLEYDGGFEVFLDRHSIHEGEAWQERLGGLIAAADVVVFLLSKSSAASELCRWEVDRATSLSKRIVPALIEQVDGASAPPALNALQYVRFDAGHSFMHGLAGLRRALRADLHWVREHTRLLTRAQEWDAAGRTENRLLSGADIAAAKAWLDQRPQDAPPPLELHRDYIAASEQAEAVRLSEERQQAKELKGALARSRRALALATGACVLAVGATAAAGYFWWRTTDSRAYAERAIAERDDYIKTLQQQLLVLDGAVAESPDDGPRSAGAAPTDAVASEPDITLPGSEPISSGAVDSAPPPPPPPPPPAPEPTNEAIDLPKPSSAPARVPAQTTVESTPAPVEAAPDHTSREEANIVEEAPEQKAQRQIDRSILQQAPVPYSRKK